MATKIKLGSKPKEFKPLDVAFPMFVGGDDTGIIPAVVFTYRTRSEFGALVNEMYAEAGNKEPATRDDGKVDFEALHASLGQKAAQHLHKCISGWGLDAELSLEALEELCDTMPAAASQLMQAYAGLCTEGRLGN